MQEFTWGALILIVGFILAMVFMFASRVGKEVKKRKRSGTVAIVFGVVSLIGLLSMFVAIPGLDQKFSLNFQPQAIGGGEENGTGEAILIDGEACYIEDTTVTLSSTNKYTGVATGGTHKYKVNGAPALELSNAGTFTASPGDVIEVLWNNGSVSNTYFSDLSTEKVPCRGTKTFSRQLDQNGTVTIEVINDIEGGVISTTKNESLAAGDKKTLTLNLKGSYQRGQPHGGVIICEYNRTNYNDCVVSIGGTSLDAVPSFYVVGTGMKAKAYTVPAIESNAQLTGNILIDVGDNEPLPLDVAGLNLTYVPNNYYSDMKNGGVFSLGVEDKYNIQTYGYIQTFPILVA
jgi:hypothetical protein